MADLETVQYVEHVQLLHEYVLGVHAQLQQLVVATLRRGVVVKEGIAQRMRAMQVERCIRRESRYVNLNYARTIFFSCLFCFPT